MIKLADIAKKTGYSINTVSHALNDKNDIAPATKDYICSVAKEMGYVRNYSASSLRSGKTHSIAIIIGDISNPLFAIEVKEIEQKLRIQGYNAFVLNTDEDEEIEREAIFSAMSKCVDGILICPTQKSTANIELLKQKNIPFVLFGRYFENIDSDYVVCDDENGGFVAAEHLLKLGHRNILFINTYSYISSSKLRLEGIKRAYKEYGVDGSRLRVTEINALSGKDVIEEIVKNNSDCSAIICFSDFFALTVAHVCNKMGKKIPEDVSIMGFDDIASKMYFPLALTSVTSAKTKMTHHAVDALLRLINKSKEKCQIVLPTKIVQRDSTAEIGDVK